MKTKKTPKVSGDERSEVAELKKMLAESEYARKMAIAEVDYARSVLLAEKSSGGQREGKVEYGTTKVDGVERQEQARYTSRWKIS